MGPMSTLQVEPWSDVIPRLTELGRWAETAALSLLFALVVVFLGWGVATLVSRFVRSLLRAVRFNAGVRSLFGPHATPRHEPAGVVAWVLYWLILAGSAVLALEALGIRLAAPVADRLNDVVPRIVTSAVLFAVGSLIAMLAGAITRRFLEGAEIRAARLQAQIVTVALTGFSALVALEQLGFAAQFVMAVGIVALAAAGLALALAFGLGCRDLARDFLVEYLRSLDTPGPKRPE